MVLSVEKTIRWNSLEELIANGPGLQQTPPLKVNNLPYVAFCADSWYQLRVQSPGAARV